jgi:hypothetical protein
MLLQKLIKLLLPFISIDVAQRLLRIILTIMEDKPSRALWQTFHNRHQQNRIDLHDDNRYPPGPGVLLAERNSNAKVDAKRHDEAEYVGLKLLSQCFAACIVGGEFRRIGGNHRIDASNAQAHDNSSYQHGRQGANCSSNVAHARHKHDQVA